jgi:phage baseplate assembly protein W
MDPLFGSDLSVVPNLVAQDASALDLTTSVRPVRKPRAGENDEFTDLQVTRGRENLAQALLLRLLTPRGALAELGHAQYGSRLSELIGRRKTEELRNLCRAFVLEAVAQEPRVETKAVDLTFDRQAERLDNFVFTVAVQPVRGGDPVSLSLEVGL